MAAFSPSNRTQHPVHYRTARVSDLDIFYREAGPQAAPVILLLHGFPTSSNMFRNLIPRVAGSFRVVAPDYPGFGQSSMAPFERRVEELERENQRLREALALPGCKRRPQAVPVRGAH